MARNAVLDVIQHTLLYAHRIVLGEKIEVALRLRFERGQLAGVDAMGIDNNLAGRRLAKKVGQTHAGYGLAAQKITQDVARTDRGQLIGIANQQQEDER